MTDHVTMTGPEKVETYFAIFKGERAGLIKALTTDLEDFRQKCDPADQKGKLCLWAYADGEWEVVPPAESEQSQKECSPYPQPTSGINLARNKTNDEKEWLLLVASHCDAWLMSRSFLNMSAPLAKVHRDELFNLINSLPTITEVVLDYPHDKQSAQQADEKDSNNMNEDDDNDNDNDDGHDDICSEYSSTAK